jgi:Flp pilus assembly protein TadG
MRSIRKNSERGNALLEFAVGWTVLWFVFAGVYQFGYAFYVYNVLLTAVANAAELGSKITYDTSTPATFQTKLQNMVVYGDETTGVKPIVPGLTTSNVTVTAKPTDFPTDITVTVTGYTIDAFFTKFALNNKPRATVAFYGQVSCAGGGCP